MNFKITPKKIILSTITSMLVTLASFRYVLPITSITITRGEMYSLSPLNGLILLNFFVVLIITLVVISLLQKNKKIRLITKDNKTIDPFE